MGTPELHWSARPGHQQNTTQDAQKGQTSHPPNLGAPKRVLSQIRRTFAVDPCVTFHASRFLAPGSEARTKLADFFITLLGVPARDHMVHHSIGRILTMSLQFLKPAGLCFLMLAIGGLFSSQAQAHGGLALADDMCRLTIGPYNMHFTGYQPDNTRNKEFCEDIPATGRTVVVLDYYGRCTPPIDHRGSGHQGYGLGAGSSVHHGPSPAFPRSTPPARSISNTTSTSQANSSVWSRWATRRSLSRDFRSR